MPPKKPKLPDAVDRRLRDVGRRSGRRCPRSRRRLGAASHGRDEPRRHWAFQPVAKVGRRRRSSDAAWVRNPVDAFVLARLEERGWTPAPPADRAELIRRVTFDLTGLPPTPEEVEAFVDDASPDAYERVVDRLLAPPALRRALGPALARRGPLRRDRGLRVRPPRPRRLAVPRLRHRLASTATSRSTGSCPSRSPATSSRRTTRSARPRRSSTGSARCGATPGIPEIALSRNEVLTERTDILGTAFLGLTVGCARCHDHKFDPISQKDYYRLQAYLAATEEHDIILAARGRVQARGRRRRRQIKGEIAQAPEAGRGRPTARTRTRLSRGDRGAGRRRCRPPPPTIPATRNDLGERTPIHVLQARRSGRTRASRSARGRSSVLVPDDAARAARRRARPAHAAGPLARLARAPADGPGDGQPGLAAPLRRGLVATANDFGTKGDRPSHPELLDWLAATLVEDGWRLKPLHRLIVLSSTYRQSSRSPLARRGRRERPGEPPALALHPAAARRPRRSATPCSRSPGG